MNESDSEFIEKYHRFSMRKAIFVAIALILLIVLVGVSITIGEREIGFWNAYSIVFDHLRGVVYEYHSDLWWDDSIIWNTRLPRAAIAVIAGAGLAVCGATMQSIMKNPLADPYTTGISSAAVFGVSVAIVMGFSVSGTVGQYGLVFNAFIFGMIPAAVILLISKMSNTTPATLILAGTAVSYFFSSLSTLVLSSAAEEDLDAAYTWQVGSLSGTIWSDLPLLVLVISIGVVFLALSSKKLNILSLGDENARSLGLNAEGYRLICLCILSFITAVIISYTGIIGFLGLIIPHIARMFIGNDNRFVIPASMILGAILLLIADIISRSVTPSGEIPVGVVMSFIGAPIFLYLIVRQKRDMW